MQGHQNHNPFYLRVHPGLQCSIGSERELYKYIISLFSSNKSKYGKIILVHVYIKFALPDYSGEVIERLQNFVVIVHVNSLNKKDPPTTLLRPSYCINSTGCECTTTTAVQKG